MPNFYAGLEALKRAGAINGSDEDTRIKRLIEAVSRRIDQETRRRFIPQTATRLYDWPPETHGPSTILWLDESLLSVTTLLSKAQDASPTTIPAADYFLEPQRYGPPYNRIEIDLSSTSAFEAGATAQRSISVAGSWGYGNDTVAAGALAEALDATETGVDVTDASLVDVGDTLLVESEQMFVSDKGTLDTTANLNGALTADKSQTTVAVNNGALVNAGEVILVNSERMYVESVTGNNLTVIRAYDGSTLAAHNDATDVYAYRTLTVTRNVNGTAAATHANSTAITKYQVPRDIEELCIAEVIAAFHQERSGWGRVVGMGEQQREFSGRTLADLRKRVTDSYRRGRWAAV